MARTLIDASLIKPFSTTFIGLGRNRTVNGDMRIDQANAGTVVTVNSSASFYTVDGFGRFFGQAADGVFTMQRLNATPPTGFAYYLGFKTTTADSSIGTSQFYYGTTAIEGNNIRDFNLGTSSAVTFTLSFWARSSLTGAFGGSFQNGAANRSYPFTYTINAANTWEKKAITVAGDTTGTWTADDTAGLNINWNIGLGSTYLGTAGSWSGNNYLAATGSVNLIGTLNATLDITGVQLEIGSAATNFEYLPFQQNLLNCYRLFEVSYPLDVKPGTVNSVNQERGTGANTQGSTYIYNSVQFKATKRAAATMNTYDVAGTLGNITITNTSNTDSNVASVGIIAGSRSFSFAGVLASGQAAKYNWVADARL